jgi:hypothetical protein
MMPIVYGTAINYGEITSLYSYINVLELTPGTLHLKCLMPSGISGGGITSE